MIDDIFSFHKTEIVTIYVWMKDYSVKVSRLKSEAVARVLYKLHALICIHLCDNKQQLPNSVQ